MVMLPCHFFQGSCLLSLALTLRVQEDGWLQMFLPDLQLGMCTCLWGCSSALALLLQDATSANLSAQRWASDESSSQGSHMAANMFMSQM